MSTIKTTKLYQLLDTFSKNERKEFARYIASPYFNRLKEPCLLYELIDKKKLLDRHLLIGKLYANQTNTDEISNKDKTRLRNAMSLLLRLAENFLEQQQLQQVDNRRLLVNSLMGRKLFKHAHNILDERFKSQRKNKHLDAQHFYTQFQLEEGRYMMEVVEKGRSLESNIVDVVENFYYYFICNVLRFYNILINRASILDIPLEHDIPQEIISFVENVAQQENFPKLAQIDLYIFKLLNQKEKEGYFHEVVSLIAEHETKLNAIAIRGRINVLFNFCMWQILAGNFSYRNHLNAIIEQNLPKGIWHTGLYLNVQLFRAYCRNSLYLGHIEKAKGIVQDYQQYLAPEKKDDMVNLCLAHIAFHEKDWATSQQYLSQFYAKGEDFYFSLYYRTLLIKLYYEQGEYEPLHAALKALNLFLYKKRNANIIEKARNSYLAIRKFTYEMAKVKEERRIRRPLALLRKEIENFGYLHERPWLLEKVSDLERKY